MKQNIMLYLLEDQIGVSSTDTLDGSHGEHNSPLAVDVGVHHTEDVLEVGRNDQRHFESPEKRSRHL
jgi:hypothetical protein